ncbi:phage tail assembly chaperone [Pseudomonas sp. 21LCFQ010]|uniref:phage tail assembly chaperone n=1 Tax=Pseudomonas sp. 21LCFQ010 TaxID=2957506 RepID=UPI00209760CA|nr:phage tail assembly chaperone [Pseudomonas sp. 21LCFQ010]MCO8161078.1 phage tail assembly chaperone [Pseudomonas sp. 21LCFQ010]
MTTKTKDETKAEAPIKNFELSDFFTLPAIQKGKKLPLTLPDGTETPHYLVVTSSDAAVARRKLLELTREGRDRDESKLSTDEVFEITQAGTIKYRAALVIGWSFDAPFSADAVAELLTNNPGLSQDVETLASNRSRFFAADSTTS